MDSHIERTPSQTPLTWLDKDPRRRLWGCWHEAAHIVVVYAVGGGVFDAVLQAHCIDGHELNASISWGVQDPSMSKVICAAGAVIDRWHGPTFTEDPSEIASKSRQDRHMLEQLMRGSSDRVTSLDVQAEFRRGFGVAAEILSVPRIYISTTAVRDRLLALQRLGTLTMESQEIEVMVAVAFHLELPHSPDAVGSMLRSLVSDLWRAN